MANLFKSVLAAASALLQSKSVTATTSAQTVTPDSGYDGLSQVTVNPQVHSETYTPAANTASNDMGANHNKRYVNTSGMIVPSGNKAITANGTGIDVSSYATASVNVPNPTLSGDATASEVVSGKTFYNSDYTKRTGTMASKAAATYYPSTSDQTISSGQYLSGAQTIKAVTTSNIQSSYIRSGYTIKVGDSSDPGRIASVTGTYSGTVPSDFRYQDTLWTNTSPSSDFTDKNVTLTYSLSYYKYIKVIYRFKKSNTQTVCTIFNVDELRTYSVGTDNCARFTIGARNTYNYGRIVKYVSETQLNISNANCIGGSSSSNSSTIPVEIVGLDF